MNSRWKTIARAMELAGNSHSVELAQILSGSFHQFFSDSLSEKTKVRMQAGLMAGRWMWKNPRGYLLLNKHLVLDPERSSLIRKGFEMVASGQYSTTEAGADIHTVAQLLGHKDLRMAARYQHLSPRS
jgi:DNA invertase Pin-like site-specific DNA recombinase